MNYARPLSSLNHLSRLYFLHIPRTAGTSFRIWLEELFDSEQCCKHYHAFELDRLDLSDLQEYRFFAGHHGYALISRFGCCADFCAVTLLREPVARELSQLKYLRAFDQAQIEAYGERTWAHRQLIRSVQSLPPSQVLRSDDFRSRFANMQVRCLIGKGPLSDSPRILGNDDLETAKRNLLNLTSFGLVEEMDRTILAISARLGLPNRVLTQRLNVAPAAADAFDADDIAATEEANTLDTQLYDFAREVFEERFASLWSQYGEATGPFDAERLASRMREAFLVGHRCVPRLASATVDASAGVVSSGWYNRFFYSPVSRWLRWAGPECESSLFLPLDREAEHCIKIEIVYTLSERIRDALSIEVDDRVLPLARSYEKLEDDRWHLALKVVVPAMPDAERQYTEIRFRAPEVVQTETAGDPDPPRSFAIGRIFVS